MVIDVRTIFEVQQKFAPSPKSFKLLNRLTQINLKTRINLAELALVARKLSIFQGKHILTSIITLHDLAYISFGPKWLSCEAFWLRTPLYPNQTWLFALRTFVAEPRQLEPGLGANSCLEHLFQSQLAILCASAEGVWQPTIAGASWISSSFSRALTINRA
jgi:hypothetical protein